MSNWDIGLGEERTRQEIQDQYGGATAAGIEPSTTTPNIFVFTDPSQGAKFGYADGWIDDRRCFQYTAQGKTGDQTLTHRNKSLLEHKSKNRSLRLFQATSIREGTKGTKSHAYIGEFEVDSDMPFLRREAPDENGVSRSVIVFRLLPLGEVLTTAEDTPVPAASSRPPRVTKVMAAATNEPRSDSQTSTGNQNRITSARMPWVSQTALMFPTLHALRELGGRADIDAIAAHVADQLGLTQQQREIPNPGVDTRPKFDYDLAWARTKLHTDGLVTNPSQKIWSLVESRTTPEDELAKSHFLKTPKEAEEVPFEMFGGEDVRRTSERKVRTNQATFRFDVLARYGCECAVCSIDESVLIEAAHIVPKADNGSDDVRNGLPLCLLHHKATEKIHPETLEVICTGGRSYEELRVTKSSLEELPKLPNKEALEYLWEATGAHLADE